MFNGERFCLLGMRLGCETEKKKPSIKTKNVLSFLTGVFLITNLLNIYLLNKKRLCCLMQVLKS